MLDSRFRQAVEAAAERHGVPALVVGTLHGGKAETHGVGVSPDERFRVASITKPFTATLAASLLDLDEAVDVWPGARVRHLLSHTSGRDCELGDLSRFGDGDEALSRLRDELSEVRRWFGPDEWWAYCNAGYWLLGALAAEHAGASYEQALEERILKPAGLDATDFGDPELEGFEPNLLTGELRASKDRRYPRARRPSGGLVSNADDLLRFAAWAMDDPTASSLRRSVVHKPGGEWGLGWALERVGGVEVWGHPGSYGGFRTSLLLVPDRGAAVVGLTNRGDGDRALEELENEFFLRTIGTARHDPPHVELPRAELEELSGRYLHADYELELSPADGALAFDLVTPDGKLPTVRAAALGGREFVIKGGPADRMRFDLLPGEGTPRFARLTTLAERAA